MKFLVADDHAIVRKGLAQILCDEFPSAVVREVSNSHEIFDELKKDRWDVILLDISMPGRNGIETLKQIRSEGIKTPVLMLSMHSAEQYAIRVFRAGASGFLNKETATDELLVAVRRVLSGRKYITPSIAEKTCRKRWRKRCKATSRITLRSRDAGSSTHRIRQNRLRNR